MRVLDEEETSFLKDLFIVIVKADFADQGLAGKLGC